MKKFAACLLALILVTGCMPDFLPAGAAAFALTGPVHVQAAEAEDYQYSLINLNSSFDEGKILKDTCYYTDDWFFQSPSLQNDALALLSMQGVSASVDNDSGGTGASFFRNLGFDDISFVGFNSTDPYDCAYTLAKKTITRGGDRIDLVAVFVMSYAVNSDLRSKGWRQNFTVNDPANTTGSNLGAEHYSYSLAADKAYNQLKSLVTSGTRFWVAGQSRGGAIAGTIAARLPKDSTYAYTFEAPAEVDSSFHGVAGGPSAPDSYSNIHNYQCSDDLVTWIPPWNMTRYGVTHSIDLNANIKGELQKLGSDMKAPDNDSQETEALIRQIMTVLLKGIPTRQEYSQEMDIPNGEKYSYQAMMVKLMGFVFGNGLNGINTQELLSQLGSLRKPVEDLIQAINTGSSQDYWNAAEGVHALLEKIISDNPLEIKDVYLLLRAAGPLLVDTNAVIPEGSDDPTASVIYLTPALSLISEADTMIYSHHFDTLIARLKTMAPAPALADINLTISDPAAGDASGKAVTEIREAIDQAASSISSNVSWNGSSAKLEDNKILYLQVEMFVPGRPLDGFKMTINGQGPVGEPEIIGKDGVNVYTATWSFTIGNPEKVEISFDNGGHGTRPDAALIPRGTKLAHSLKLDDQGVIEENGKKWKFMGWYEKDTDLPWNQLSADHDTVLKALWKEYIDQVNISLTLPKEGDIPESPSVPENAPYQISEYTFLNDMYNEETRITSGRHILKVSATCQEGIFAGEDNKYGDYEYLGTVYINGQKTYDYSCYKDENGNITLVAYWEFTPEKAEEPIQNQGGTEDIIDEKEKAPEQGQSETARLKKSFYPLRLKLDKQGKKAVRLKWKKIKAAASYEVYGSKVGRKLKKLAVTENNIFTINKLKKKCYYTFVVVARDSSGKALAKSARIFAAAKGRGIYKSVTIKVKGRKKKTVKMKAGSKLRIKVKARKTRNTKKYVGIRYESSNPAIAQVTSKGVIKARKKGRCKIYAYTQNGSAAAIKVVVK